MRRSLCVLASLLLSSTACGSGDASTDTGDMVQDTDAEIIDIDVELDAARGDSIDLDIAPHLVLLPHEELIGVTWQLESQPEGSAQSLSEQEGFVQSFRPLSSGSYELLAVVSSDSALAGRIDYHLHYRLDVDNEAPTGSIEVAGAGITTIRIEATLLPSQHNADLHQYSWGLARPDGSSASLESSDALITAFTPDLPGSYQLSATINDGEDQIVVQSGEITVTPHMDLRDSASLGKARQFIYIERLDTLAMLERAPVGGTSNLVLIDMEDLSRQSIPLGLPGFDMAIDDGEESLMIRLEADDGAIRELDLDTLELSEPLLIPVPPFSQGSMHHRGNGQLLILVPTTFVHVDMVARTFSIESANQIFQSSPGVYRADLDAFYFEDSDARGDFTRQIHRLDGSSTELPITWSKPIGALGNNCAGLFSLDAGQRIVRHSGEVYRTSHTEADDLSLISTIGAGSECINALSQTRNAGLLTLTGQPFSPGAMVQVLDDQTLSGSSIHYDLAINGELIDDRPHFAFVPVPGDRVVIASELPDGELYFIEVEL